MTTKGVLLILLAAVLLGGCARPAMLVPSGADITAPTVEEIVTDEAEPSPTEPDVTPPAPPRKRRLVPDEQYPKDLRNLGITTLDAEFPATELGRFILCKFPFGHLIDAGSSDEAARIMEYLRRKLPEPPKMLILRSGDDDNLGMVPDIVRWVKTIKMLQHTLILPPEVRDQAMLDHILREVGTPQYEEMGVHEPDWQHRDRGRYVLDIIGPLGPPEERVIAVLATMPQIRVLFLGDASEHLQRHILEQRIDVHAVELTHSGWSCLEPATLRQLAPEAIIVTGCTSALEIPPPLASVIADIGAVITTSGPGRWVRLRTEGYVFSVTEHEYLPHTD